MATRTKKPRRTAERILDTTLELFNRFGEPNVSTTLISAELGISPGNLYYHYPAKEELITRLYDPTSGEINFEVADPRAVIEVIAGEMNVTPEEALMRLFADKGFAATASLYAVFGVVFMIIVALKWRADSIWSSESAISVPGAAAISSAMRTASVPYFSVTTNGSMVFPLVL